MPIQKEKELTTKELQYRWIIGLESGMFRPQKDFLRSLILGNKFEYRHSPLGILCTVSNLGEFVPDTDPFVAEKEPDIPIHHFYQLKDRAAYRAKWKEDLLTPPQLLIERVSIFPRWVRTSQEIYRLRIFPVPDHLKLEIQQASKWQYWRDNASIAQILSDPAIPEYRRLPIIGELLRYKLDKKY